MIKVRFNLRKVATIVACLAVTTMFAACDKTNPDDDDKGGDGKTGIGSATSTTDPGVVINGIRWATRNVDKPGTFAAKPEDAGMFYQWNSKIGWSAIDPMKNSNGGTTWNRLTEDISISLWQTSNNPCPKGWRLPTREEFQKFEDAGVWTTGGCRFGSGANTIFLPAAGERHFNDGELRNEGSYGSYWTNARVAGYYQAYYFYFNSLNAGTNSYGNTTYGYSCRCVAE